MMKEVEIVNMSEEDERSNEESATQSCWQETEETFRSGIGWNIFGYQQEPEEEDDA